MLSVKTDSSAGYASIPRPVGQWTYITVMDMGHDGVRSLRVHGPSDLTGAHFASALGMRDAAFVQHVSALDCYYNRAVTGAPVDPLSNLSELGQEAFVCPGWRPQAGGLPWVQHGYVPRRSLVQAWVHLLPNSPKTILPGEPCILENRVQ